MKRKITAIVAVILICCAVYMLVPYTPMPNAEDITQVQVLCVYIGDTAVDITDKVDVNTVRALLPQVKARRFPNRWHGMRESGEYRYEIQVLYGERELCIDIGEGNYAYVYEVSRPAPWIHYLSEREGIPDKLTALCEDTMEQ